MLDNVLFLSVHRDDECLSAGGTLLKCDDLHIHYFNSVHPLVDQDVYDTEAKNVQKALNCAVTYTNHQKVNGLHLYPIASFIAEIESLINIVAPDTLIIPHKSYNQDHRVIYETAITASRVHDRNFFVKNILVAEQPETHAPGYPEYPFEPQLFIPIDIDKKLELYHIYKSQQRDHRSDEHIKALATFRGMQANVPYAEAFSVLRMVL